MAEQLAEPQETHVAAPAWDATLFAVGACILVAVSLLFPGDVSFINDEAKLLGHALDANEAGTLAERGLMGTVGIHYGPLPTWYYQLALIATKNPIAISAVKNTLHLALLLSWLLGIARELSLPRSPLLLTIVSPYLYFLGRNLWDDGFIVPLAAWLAWSYVRFARTAAPRYLLFGIAITCLFTLTQLKMLSLVIAFYVTLLVFERRAILAGWRTISAGMLGAIASVTPYGIYVLRNIEFAGSGVTSPISERLWHGLTPVSFFSFFRWADYYLPEMLSDAFFVPLAVHHVLIVTSSLVIAFGMAGMYVGLRDLVTHWRASSTLPSDALTFLFSLTIAINLLFQLVTGKPHHPQYHYVVAIPAFYFLWSYYARSLGEGWFRLGASVQFLAQLLLWLAMIVFIHENGGGRSVHYGATLANQIEVVRKLRTFPPQSTVSIGVRNMQLFPHAHRVLDRLVPESEPSGGEPAALVIDYRDPDAATTGWITVRPRH